MIRIQQAVDQRGWMGTGLRRVAARGGGGLAFLVALATLVTGQLDVTIGDMHGSSATPTSPRPLVLTLVLATLAGRGVIAARVLLPIALLVAILPVTGLRGSTPAHGPLRRSHADGARLHGARARSRSSPRHAPGAEHLRRRRAEAGCFTRTSTTSGSSGDGSAVPTSSTACSNRVCSRLARTADPDWRRRLPGVQGQARRPRSADLRLLPLRECLAADARALCGVQPPGPRAADSPIMSASRQPLGRRPRLNEEARLDGTLAELVAFLERQPWDWEIRVVDDGSADARARSPSATPRRRRGSSCSASRIAGRAAPSRPACSPRPRRFRFICDADLSMPVSELPRFLPPALGRRRRRDRQSRGARRPPHRRAARSAPRGSRLQLCRPDAVGPGDRGHAVRIQDVHGGPPSKPSSRSCRSTAGRSTSKSSASRAPAGSASSKCRSSGTTGVSRSSICCVTACRC